nr:hypothetical protein [Paenibacillus xylanexedens]
MRDIEPVPVSVVAGIPRFREVFKRKFDQIRFAAVNPFKPFVFRKLCVNLRRVIR